MRFIFRRSPNIDYFKSTTSTGSTNEMIEREFDNRTKLIVDPCPMAESRR